MTDIQMSEEEQSEYANDMELVVPPHLMMQTCKACSNNCRGCFAGPSRGSEFCYECMHGYLYEKNQNAEEGGQCVADPNWSQTDSEVHVRANKQNIH